MMMAAEFFVDLNSIATATGFMQPTTPDHFPAWQKFGTKTCIRTKHLRPSKKSMALNF